MGSYLRESETLGTRGDAFPSSSFAWMEWEDRIGTSWLGALGADGPSGSEGNSAPHPGVEGPPGREGALVKD